MLLDIIIKYIYNPNVVRGLNIYCIIVNWLTGNSEWTETRGPGPYLNCDFLIFGPYPADCLRGHIGAAPEIVRVERDTWDICTERYKLHLSIYTDT